MRLLPVSLLAIAMTLPCLPTLHAQMGTSGVESNGALAGRFTDREFLEMLMQGAAAQIEWSRIAQARSSDADVKAFAKTVENNNFALAHALLQHGPDYHAVFDKTVTGKNKDVSEKLRAAPETSWMRST